MAGYLIQRAFVSPLLARDRAREPMSVPLVTLGLALVLENVRARALLRRLQDRAQTDLSIATFKVQGVIVSVPRLVGLGAMLLTCLALYVFLTRTDLGLDRDPAGPRGGAPWGSTTRRSTAWPTA